MAYGLYLHVPYCKSRCRYCDFYTQGGSRAVPDAYVDALLRDFAALAPKGPDGLPQRPHSVYFGGGTPGLLSPAQVGRILAAARPVAGAEVTLEANPESAEEERLRGFSAAGVNRLSLGVQTANDESLRRLGRLHTRADAKRALSAARAAGFANISADVMLALPGYTAEELDETLALVLEGGVTHVSAYLLKIEEGTAFGKCPPEGLPGADEAAEFYHCAAEKLQAAGLARYEISNFARPGFEGRHNLLYWDAQNWLGLGPAAHSHMEGARFSFGPEVDAFLAGGLAPCNEGELTAEDYIMLRLRLAAGLEEKALEERFGVRLSQRQKATLARLESAGYAVKTPGGWALTGEGMLVQNAVLAELL